MAFDSVLKKSIRILAGSAKRKLVGWSDVSCCQLNVVKAPGPGNVVTPGGTIPAPRDFAKFTPNFSLMVLSTSRTSISNTTSPGFRSFAMMMRSASRTLSALSRMTIAFRSSFTYRRLVSSIVRRRFTVSLAFALDR